MADDDTPVAAPMELPVAMVPPAKRSKTETEAPPPLPRSPSLPLTVDIVNPNQLRAIYANNKLLWSNGTAPANITAREWTAYKRTRDSLLVEKQARDPLLVEKRLSEDVLADKLLAIRGADSLDAPAVKVFCQSAVQSANLPCIELFSECGEMVLQQSVYNRLTTLIHAVSLAISRSGLMYAADQDVGTAHFVNTTEVPSKTFALDCKPDAALRMKPDLYCVAMMAIKAKSGVGDILDMAKCVLMLSMSALTLRKTLGNKSSGSETGFPIFFPFVIGSGMTARLYAVRLAEDGDLEVVFVSDAKMHNDAARTEFAADLMALVLPLASLVCKYETEIRRLGLTKAPSGKADTAFSALSLSITTQRSNRKASKSEPSADQGGAQATLASLANFSLLQTYHVHSRRHKSPYYFLGTLDGQRVFCKVWRDGDRSLRGIQDEMKLQQQAHECGVPSPAVVLSQTDVCRPTMAGQDGQRDKWHVLIMEYLPRDTVTVEKIRAMSLSLVRAVLMLHEHGLLHCDIKPQNLAWDSQQEQVYLLDFGHAQKEQGAKSYRATEWFEAPEIAAKQPHNRASDAYSVGATIESIADNLEYHLMDDVDTALVSQVAEKLMAFNVAERLTLAKAEATLATEPGQLVTET